MTTAQPSFVRAAGLLAGGFLAWSGHFVFVYGWTGLACARPDWGWADRPFDIAQLGILVATMVAAGAILALMPATRRAPDRFLGEVGFAAALLSLLAVLWEAASALLVPACQ